MHASIPPVHSSSAWPVSPPLPASGRPCRIRTRADSHVCPFRAVDFENLLVYLLENCLLLSETRSHSTEEMWRTPVYTLGTWGPALLIGWIKKKMQNPSFVVLNCSNMQVKIPSGDMKIVILLHWRRFSQSRKPTSSGQRRLKKSHFNFIVLPIL